MKLSNKFVRTMTAAAVLLGAAAMLSVGAFAAEADINDPTIAGYLPPRCTAAMWLWVKKTPLTAATAHRKATRFRAMSC